MPDQILPFYAELHALSNYSFQRGASRPAELVQRAAALGYSGLAITDECSVAGVVQAYSAAKGMHAFKLLLGSEFALSDGDGWAFIVLARNRNGWGNLCEFITAARREADKGSYRVSLASSDFALLQDCEVLLLHPAELDWSTALALGQWAKTQWGSHVWLAVELLLGIDDVWRLDFLQRLGQACQLPLVATGGVQMHVRSRKPLHDVISAVRLGKPVAQCGFDLQANAERHLRPRLRLGQIYPPDLLAHTLVVAGRCTFTLDEIRYQYPMESVPPGMTPAQALRQLTLTGAAKRYPEGVPGSVLKQIEHELTLIADCQYEMYFLTVEDIVRFARSQGILCQGRGSAANSVVCYCLGITEVDPTRQILLFERFISRARKEPPDIDVDFEHERREEVIQYIYAKYGHDRAAIAAVVTTYRSRSAVRDVGKALGLPPALVDAVAKDLKWFEQIQHSSDQLVALMVKTGVRVHPQRLQHWQDLTQQLRGFPRHLSQHVGGFVLTQGKLMRLVPIENATMKNRSVIQWEKDDLETMGLMKVDVLALGMLSAIRKCLTFISQRCGSTFGMQDVPKEDPATYAMIRAADTIGVFQIESRAQMSMLPRLKPEKFYDLVVQVAIVRPGPIQGGMVHPYLRRRQGLEEANYVKDELKPALKRTLGVPIFQEQVMQISMIAAGFSAEKADRLRRAMAAWKRKGGVDAFRQPLIDGMLERGYPQDFAERIFQQILGFGDYGFPESHAFSFALLAYVTAWLKCHEPACFLAALINSQPMGFYTASQLVQDARRHRVDVRPPDVICSDWDCTLEDIPGQAMPAVRLGLRLVGGLSHTGVKALMAARQQASFTSTEDMARRANLDRQDLDALAAGDALVTLAGHRRQQVWAATGLHPVPAILRGVPVHEDLLALPEAPEGEEITFDYASLGLTLRRHPVALLRARLQKMRLQSARDMHDLPHGCPVRACGLVTVRQQPQTANGTIFVTLEDETGPVNVIVWKGVRQRQREALLHSRLLAVYGIWQRDVGSGGEVRHLVAHQLRDLTPLLGRLGELSSKSRDFH
jgi:error-prone DNA polymerase